MNISETLKYLVSEGCIDIEFKVRFDHEQELFGCVLKFTRNGEVMFCAQQFSQVDFDIDLLFKTIASDYMIKYHGKLSVS